MEQACMVLLLAVCVITSARAQLGLTGAVDTDWLMDDPQKVDRLPIWSQLLGNRGFGYGAHARTNRSPISINSRWINPSTNSGNNWAQTLQNLYQIMLWRQMLGNQNNKSRATTSAPPRATTSNTSGKSTGQNWGSQLQNFYRIALWNRLLNNQRGSNTQGR